MNRPALAMAVVALALSGACASERDTPAGSAEAKEASAGDEHTRYRDLKSDPNWDSAESANEQLEGD